MSDLASGIFHWSVDNYGDGDTPVLGNVIAAFQGHHGQPWTITMREFSNNTYKTCIPTLPFLLLCASDVAHPNWQVFWASFAFCVIMAQQFHSWSHMQARELPPAVRALQVRCKTHTHTHFAVPALFRGAATDVDNVYLALMLIFFRICETTTQRNPGCGDDYQSEVAQRAPPGAVREQLLHCQRHLQRVA